MKVKKKRKNAQSVEERYYTATHWRLMWLKFRKHKLAIGSICVLGLFYLVGIFCEFFSPYLTRTVFADYAFAPPQRVHFIDADRKFHFRPFVYGLEKVLDDETWEWIYSENKDVRYPIRFFYKGEPYKLWGLFHSRIHFFGVDEPGRIFLFGTDKLGRDLLSRNAYSFRISLSIGLVGVALAFFIGCILGGISGYFGGSVDMVIQRIVEFLISIPTIPLWMAFSAAMPTDWGPIKVYFVITLILSIVGWCGLARVVRGKFLELREEEFVMAAKISGTGELSIITRHLMPSFLSYLVVDVTLAIPGMILGETALSFLGLGLRPPVVSWGVLLKDAQNLQTVALHPWLLIPGIFVIVTVLCFSFLGDGIRDAADPYK